MSYSLSPYEITFLVPMSSRNKRVRCPPEARAPLIEEVDEEEQPRTPPPPPKTSQGLDAARRRVRQLKAELIAAEREVLKLERAQSPEEQLHRALFFPVARQMRDHFGGLTHRVEEE